MRTVKGLRAGLALAAVMSVTVLANAASAQNERRFTTERPGSILIFPKVINTSNRSTVIQITNTSNMLRRAHCFYINGATINGFQLWQITDFELALTRQHPTHWSTEDGRPFDPSDEAAGIDPGSVPPTSPDFTGALVCVQVNVGGDPDGANSLKGEATIATTENDGVIAVSKYNAIAIQAMPNNPGGGTTGPNSDNVLKLDNIEYAACPAGAHLNFTAEGAQDDIVNDLGDGPSVVSTTLAFLPCDMDFENLVPGRTVLAFESFNEMEEGQSGSFTVDCWREINLGATEMGPLTETRLGSTYGYMRLVADSVGAVGVANVLRVGQNGAVSTAATNLHFVGNNPEESLDSPPSEIRLPQ